MMKNDCSLQAKETALRLGLGNPGVGQDASLEAGDLQGLRRLPVKGHRQLCNVHVRSHCANAIAIQLGGVVVVEVIQNGRVGVEIYFVIGQVEVYHFDIPLAAAGRTLLVGADPVNHPLFHTVAVVIKAHKVQRRAVVMAV